MSRILLRGRRSSRRRRSGRTPSTATPSPTARPSQPSTTSSRRPTPRSSSTPPAASSPAGPRAATAFAQRPAAPSRARSAGRSRRQGQRAAETPPPPWRYLVTLTNTLACVIALIFGASGLLNTLALPKARELAAETGFSVAAYRRIGVLQLAGVAGVTLGPAMPPLGGFAGGPGFSSCSPELRSYTAQGRPGCRTRARRRVRRACRLISRGLVRLKRCGSSPRLHGWAAPAVRPSTSVTDDADAIAMEGSRLSPQGLSSHRTRSRAQHQQLWRRSMPIEMTP